MSSSGSSSSSGRSRLLGAVTAFLAAVLLLYIGCSRSEGPGDSNDTLRVAAASDLRFALDEIVGAYVNDRSGARPRVEVIYGSSGKLAEQIRSGAPFDVFLSADASYVRALVDAGSVDATSVSVYAIGRIALYVREDLDIPVATEGITALVRPQMRRIAIADPSHAPYGRAAIQALEKYGLGEELSTRLVRGDTAAQAVQFVDSGGAEAGIVALGLVPASHRRGQVWPVPEDAHEPLIQTAAVVASTPTPAQARDFMEFLASDMARGILERYGFGLPELAAHRAPRADSLLSSEAHAAKALRLDRRPGLSAGSLVRAGLRRGAIPRLVRQPGLSAAGLVGLG